jgi:hypothetical protein
MVGLEVDLVKREGEKREKRWGRSSNDLPAISLQALEDNLERKFELPHSSG